MVILQVIWWFVLEVELDNSLLHIDIFGEHQHVVDSILYCCASKSPQNKTKHHYFPSISTLCMNTALILFFFCVNGSNEWIKGLGIRMSTLTFIKLFSFFSSLYKTIFSLGILTHISYPSAFPSRTVKMSSKDLWTHFRNSWTSRAG